MGNPRRASLSVGGAFFDSLHTRAAKIGVPANALAEIITAKALGIAFETLPKRTRQWVPKVFPTTNR